MPPSRFDLARVSGRSDLLAVVVAFERRSGALDLPPYWAALVTTALGERRRCTAGSEVSGQDAEEVMFFRSGPFVIRFDLGPYATADGHACRFRLDLQLRIGDERSDATAFRESLGGRRELVRDALAMSLDGEIQTTVRAFASARDAAELLDRLDRDALAERIATHLQPALFRWGLHFCALPTAEIDSESYRQARQEQGRLQRRRQRFEVSRQLQRAIDQARAEHVQRLEHTLQRLSAVADGSPQVELAELLDTCEESHRNELYRLLWNSVEVVRPTRWIVAASGQELLYFDPADLARPNRRVTLETSAGALRSLSTYVSADGAPLLAVGAARGVVLAEAASGAVREAYVFSDPENRTLRGGFNSVALAGEYLYGTHSELGVVRWAVGRPDSCTTLLDDMTGRAQTVRHGQFASGRVWLSVDQVVVCLAAARAALQRPDAGSCDVYSGSAANITALFCSADEIWAGNAEGDVLCWRPEQPTAPRTLHRGSGRAVESLTVLCGALPRVLFTDTSTVLRGQVLNAAGFTCAYRAGGQTIRRAEFAEDLIVGTNDVRDRLFCWNTQRPEDPPTVVPIGRLSGHSVQDVCLLAEP